MRGSFLIAVFWCLAQAASLVAAAPAHAETNAQPEAAGTAPAKKGMPWESQPASQPSAAEPEVVPPASSAAPSTPSDAGSDVASPAETVQLVPPNPIVAIIRAKLAEPGTAEGTEADDISALQAFYGTWSGAPLWTTEMGFSARGQAALFEIAKADDWGLDAKDFALPESGALTASDEAQALAEIKLDLAILKYARFARIFKNGQIELDLGQSLGLIRRSQRARLRQREVFGVQPPIVGLRDLEQRRLPPGREAHL